jgi:hypothetical protein
MGGGGGGVGVSGVGGVNAAGGSFTGTNAGPGVIATGGSGGAAGIQVSGGGGDSAILVSVGGISVSTDAIENIGSSAKRFNNVFANQVRGGAIVAAPLDFVLSGANPTLTVNGSATTSKSYIRLNSGVSSGTIQMSSGVDGQYLTIVNVGGTSTPSFATGAGSYTVTTAFTLGSASAFRSISFIYDGTLSKWIETGRS